MISHLKKGDIIIYHGLNISNRDKTAKTAKIGKFVEYSHELLTITIDQWVSKRFRGRTQVKFKDCICKGGKNYQDTKDNFPEYFI